MARTPSSATARKGGRPDTSNMSKSEKFTFLANQRVSKALGVLDNLERLANARNYEYTQAQADRIRTALSSRVKEVADAFDNALKGGGATASRSKFDVNA